MVSLKQLQTLHWIAELGTFEKAAARLHTSQSAISKRIRELESITGIDVFDRSSRGARLTEKGEELLHLAQQMMDLEGQIHRIKTESVKPVRKLQLGVTELTAWTWLPRLVGALRARYPKIIIEPEVDVSRVLFERLAEGSIELIIVPETFRDPEITAVPLARVQNVWMGKPGLMGSHPKPIPLQQLAQYPIMAQGTGSGSGLYLNKWLKSRGVHVSRLTSSNSLNATLGLTVAGLGISYFPRACFQSLVDAGKLEIIPVEPPLPEVPYVAMYRTDRRSVFTEEVAEIATQVCDFSHQLHC